MLSTLPPTDTRFRTDSRGYEYGALTEAADEKHRLEVNQRKRRKKRHEEEIKWKPLWFDFEIKDKEILVCEFNHQYFKCKEKGEWPKEILNLYLDEV